jgi:hypothetical protein
MVLRYVRVYFGDGVYKRDMGDFGARAGLEPRPYILVLSEIVLII